MICLQQGLLDVADFLTDSSGDIVGDLSMEDCRGAYSLLGHREGWQRLVVDVDQLERVLGLIARLRYGDRHRVKSGITGWAQVHGLRGQTSLAERVEWDNYYIAHWSIGLDLKILALTLFAMFREAE